MEDLILLCVSVVSPPPPPPRPTRPLFYLSYCQQHVQLQRSDLFQLHQFYQTKFIFHVCLNCGLKWGKTERVGPKYLRLSHLYDAAQCSGRLWNCLSNSFHLVICCWRWPSWLSNKIHLRVQLTGSWSRDLLQKVMASQFISFVTSLVLRDPSKFSVVFCSMLVF
jgi:hypothetical protein